MAQEYFVEQLTNGMVLVAERMEGLESAAFSLAVPAGCIRDPDPLLGLANYTCEMVQRGAGDLDSRQVIEALDRLGADRASSTSSIHTSYSASLLADNLPQTLAIYADLVRRPTLAEDQIEDARLVCLQEVQAIEDDLPQKTMLRLRRETYGLPWGRSAVGEIECLERTTHRDIQEYFRNWYTPCGTILAVAGKIDWPRLKDDVLRLFSEWSGRPQAEVPIPSTEPVNVHLASDSQQTQIGIAYATKTFRDPDYLLARAAVGVLSDGMSSRLFTHVREERGLCYTVYANHHSLRDSARVLCYSGTSTDRAQETLDVLLAELQRLAEGVTDEEVARLKARTKSALIMQQESSASRSGSLVGDWYHLGRIRPMRELSALIDELSRERLNQYLRNNPAERFTVVTLGKNPLEVRVGVPTESLG